MMKKLIIVFGIFIAIGFGLFYLLTMGDIGVEYPTSQVTIEEGGQSLADTGHISSKQIRRYYGNGGHKIEEMSLELGDYVSKGQLLIQYENNHEQIDLEIQKVKKQIEALEAAYSEAQSGTDMGAVNHARIQISSIQNQMETAIKEKERIETLYKEGVVSLVEYEERIQAIDQLNTQLDIAQNTYNQAARGLSNNMREKYEAEIGALLLSIDLLEQRREDGTIYADIEGVVTELNTFQGDQPTAGRMLIELQDPSEKIILVDFMVEDAMRIEPGMKAEINDSTLGIYLEGLVVDQVYPKAFVSLSELGVEENRQTIAINLSSEAKGLAFGSQVNTEVMVESSRDVLVIPEGALIQDAGKHYVKVLENNEPVQREVKIGIRLNNKIEIIQGLAEGDEVLINYQED